jgi:putative PIN family toxin of toxin-antitoxin system
MKQDHSAWRPTVVVDTNVFLSAFGCRDGATSQHLQRILQVSELLCSAETMNELSEKLHNKWMRARYNPLVCSVIEAMCRREMVWVEVSPSVEACRDKTDNKFLDLAVTAKADMIISGDKDLLELKSYKGIGHIIPIVRPGAFELFLHKRGRDIMPKPSRMADFLARPGKMRDM